MNTVSYVGFGVDYVIVDDNWVLQMYKTRGRKGRRKAVLDITSTVYR